MSDVTRRDMLRIGAGVAAGAALGGAGALPASAADKTFKPEPNASIRVLRWKRFVQGDEDMWMKNTEKFTKATGVKVRVDNEGWEDVRPKSALAANIGNGPDVFVGWLDDPHLYPEKLIDLSDLATYLGDKYGGWYDAARRYGTTKEKGRERWLGLPLGASGALLNYRKSWVKEAGFDKFPTDFENYLKLCQNLKKTGHPAGFALSHATGDSETWMHNILWGFGGKLVDEKNNVAINSPETVRALEYMKELAATFIEGVTAWSGVSNNNAFLEGKISLTSNGISIYYAARTSARPEFKVVAEDMDHAAMPIGPVGRPMELHLLSQAYIFKYSKFPNASKEYLRFMWERDQYVPWQEASLGYVSHPLKAYGQTPFWSSDPKILPFRDICDRLQYHGYAGTLGYASAACLADWIVVDMFSQVTSGQKTPKEAAAEAEKRAQRYYKI
ncbi:MAG: extracellular solute-binding protein [Alphaproteobacteria bacterium]|nr:extracellular solute-binding protein [Alphaproteobacteria bacterium]